jgi:hypothetical protein
MGKQETADPALRGRRYKQLARSPRGSGLSFLGGSKDLSEDYAD